LAVAFSSPFPISVPQLMAGKIAFGKARRYIKLKMRWPYNRIKKVHFLVNTTTLRGQLLYVTSNRGSLEYKSLQSGKREPNCRISHTWSRRHTKKKMDYKKQ